MGSKYLCLDLYNLGVIYEGTHKGAFIDVLPKKLTIDIAGYKPIDYSHRTLFKEVKLKKFSDIKYEELAEIKPVMHSEGWEKRIFELFCDILEEKEGSYSLGLSSGYDSRLIALALKHRGLKIDEYVECFGEHEGFMAVVRYLKIKNHRILFPGDHSKRLMAYLNDCVDSCDGIVGLHLNPYWTPYPEDTGLLTGCGANTLTECMKSYDNYFTKMAGIKRHTDMGERMFRAKKYSYYQQLAKFKLKGYPIHTFSDYRFLREIAKVKNWQVDKRRFSQYMLDYLDPELSKIPRTDVQALIRRGERILDKKDVDTINDNYKNTWYGKHFPVEAVSLVDNHPFWAHYQSALLCDRLIKQGYNIKLKKK